MTLAQKKARENFKKAIAYRKKTGCSLKQAFAHVKGKKVGATKIIERGEKKNAKVTKVLQRVRSKKGTLKGIKRVGNTDQQYQLIRVKDGFYLTYNLSSGKHSFIDSKDWGVLMTKTQAEQMKRKFENEGVNVSIVEYKKNTLKRVSGASHKDTKSHNVNIRVVSGINDAAISEIKHINDMLKKWKIVLSTLEQQKKLEKNSLNKTLIRNEIYRVKNVISDFKNNLNRLKKHIK
jgi:hypothetical protein